MNRFWIYSVFLFICLKGFSQQDEDLILYLPFSGNANDLSVYKNHGTIYGATLTDDRFSNPNSAYYFDGNDDYIEIPASSSLNSISNYFSVSVWVKPLNRYYNTIISKDSSFLTFQLVKYLRPGIKFSGLNIDYSGAENYWTRILLHDIIPENEWTHLVCTYDNIKEKIEMYINGELVHQCHASGNINPGEGNLTVGVRLSEIYPEHFHGTMDDIKIYSRYLPPEEVNELFEETFCTNYITVVDTSTFYDTIVTNQIVTIYDTVTRYESIAVTDTLYIDVKFYDYSESTVVKVYPNPTNNFITIDVGDLINRGPLKLRVSNSLSQTLMESALNTQVYKLKLSHFYAKGLYYLAILNESNETLAVKKIILR